MCRVVWRWDLHPAPVCNRVASFLDDVSDRPLVGLSALNPRLFTSVRRALSLPPITALLSVAIESPGMCVDAGVCCQVPLLGQVRMLRVQLSRMKPFVNTCLSRVTLLALLEPRSYYMDSVELWALSDFAKVCGEALRCSINQSVHSSLWFVAPGRADCVGVACRALG